MVDAKAHHGVGVQRTCQVILVQCNPVTRTELGPRFFGHCNEMFLYRIQSHFAGGTLKIVTVSVLQGKEG